MSEEELISAYVDGQLSEVERAAFEARLTQDSALRRRVLATRLLVREARRLPPVALPRNFILSSDVRRTPARARVAFPRWAYQLGALAAAALCVALVVWDLGFLAARPEPVALPASPTAQPYPPDALAQERAGPLDAEPRALALPEPTPVEAAPAPSPSGAASPLTLPRAFAFALLIVAIILGVRGWGRRVSST